MQGIGVIDVRLMGNKMYVLFDFHVCQRCLHIMTERDIDLEQCHMSQQVETISIQFPCTSCRHICESLIPKNSVIYKNLVASFQREYVRLNPKNQVIVNPEDLIKLQIVKLQNDGDKK